MGLPKLPIAAVQRHSTGLLCSEPQKLRTAVRRLRASARPHLCTGAASTPLEVRRQLKWSSQMPNAATVPLGLRLHVLHLTCPQRG